MTSKELEAIRQKKREERAKHCAHFNGVQHDKCEAGESYEDKRKERLFVCFGECGGCDKYKAAGMEAVLEFERMADEFTKKFITARSAISAKHGKNRGIVDKMPCPVCKTGELRYSISSYNGHCHAACTTKDCVSWME